MDNYEKIAIQWFPGHMAKTRRMISENLKNVDAVIDVRDARIPYSSANPEISRLCGDKPRLILLNKCSLSDEAANARWLAGFREEALPCLDILYMTRVQRERFFNEEDYLRLKDSYILTPEKLRSAKKDLAILHPLPRVNEISVAVDDDERACYFKQVLNGKYMRMALILKLLEEASK